MLLGDLGECRRGLHDPAVERGVVDVNAPLFKDFFEIAVRAGVANAEEDRVQNDIFGNCTPLNEITGSTYQKDRSAS